MKITKEQLKQIIKEELEVTLTDDEAAEMFGEEVRTQLEEGGPAGHYEKKRLERGPTFDIQDAIQMLEAEEDTTGTLHHVINRLHAALDKLEGGGGPDKGEESPDDIIHQDEHGNVIYRWQQDEFDEHQAAWKNFMKRNKK